MRKYNKFFATYFLFFELRLTSAPGAPYITTKKLHPDIVTSNCQQETNYYEANFLITIKGIKLAGSKFMQHTRETLILFYHILIDLKLIM